MKKTIDMHLEVEVLPEIQLDKAQRLLAYFIGFWMDMLKNEGITFKAYINGKEVKK